MLKKFGITTLTLLFIALVSADFIFTPKTDSALPAPTEGEEDGEDHEGRDAFFNLIHTGSPLDSSWEKTTAAVRQSRADRRIRSGRAVLPGTIETYGSLSGKWIERGAKNQAGRVITTDVLESRDMILLGTEGGNIMLGTTAGDSWEILNDKIKLNTKSVHLFENGTSVRAAAVTGSGVYITDNSGLTWTKSFTGSPVSSAYSRTSNTLYIHDGSGKIYTSSDKGTTFTASTGTVSTASGKARIWTARYANSPLFILSGTTLYSYSGGTVTQKGTVPASISTAAVSLSGDDNWKTETLFAGVDEASVAVFRSIDGGSNWTRQGTSPATYFFGGNCRSFYSVNDSTIYVGEVETYRSTDRGVNWTKINTWGSYYGDPANKLHADIPEIRGYKNKAGNPLTLISTDGGTYLSLDDLTYKNITMKGIRNSQYYGSQTRMDQPEIVWAGAQDQGIQFCGGSQTTDIYDFRQVTSGDEGSFASSDNGKSVWFTYVYGSLYYAPNSSVGTIKGAGKPDDADSYMWMCPTLADPQDPQTVYVCGNYIHKVNYNGSTFTKAKYSTFNFGATISAIAISPVNRNYWYAATTAKKLYTSTDNGITWTLKNGTIANNNYLVGQEIIPDPKVLGKIYLSGNGTPAVLVSNDHGTTFSGLGATPLGATTVYNMVLSDDGKYLFAASTYSPYVYVFSEDKWYDLGEGAAPDQQYYNVEYIPSIKTVRYTTYGRGIWDFKIESGAASPFITVTSPNGTENYLVGQSVQVNWQMNVQDSVKIALMKDGVWFKHLFSADKSQSSGNWKIPADLAPGNYTIRIGLFDLSVKDESDKPFAVAPRTLAITAPNGAEQYLTGQSVSIIWSSSDDSTAVVGLTKNGTWIDTIGTVTAQTGTLTWKIPDTLTPGDQYRIRIVSQKYTALLDNSDQPFTVSKPVVKTVNLASFNGGETVPAGETASVIWSSNADSDAEIYLMKNGVQHLLLGTAPASAGELSWSVPDTLSEGKLYSIKIVMKKYPELTDTSDARFSVVKLNKLTQKHLSAVSATSEETKSENGAAANLLDGSQISFWQSEWSVVQKAYPHEIVIKTDTVTALMGISAAPRQGTAAGRIKGYEIYVSSDGIEWKLRGTGNWAGGSAPSYAALDSASYAPYIKLKLLSGTAGGTSAALSELNLFYRHEAIVPLIYRREAAKTLSAVGVQGSEVHLNIPSEGSYQIELYTLSGRRVFSEVRSMTGGVQRVDFGESVSASQLYLLRVIGGKSELRQKIVLR